MREPEAASTPEAKASVVSLYIIFLLDSVFKTCQKNQASRFFKKSAIEGTQRANTLRDNKFSQELAFTP